MSGDPKAEVVLEPAVGDRIYERTPTAPRSSGARSRRGRRRSGSATCGTSAAIGPTPPTSPSTSSRWPTARPASTSSTPAGSGSAPAPRLGATPTPAAGRSHAPLHPGLRRRARRSGRTMSRGAGGVESTMETVTTSGSQPAKRFHATVEPSGKTAPASECRPRSSPAWRRARGPRSASRSSAASEKARCRRWRAPSS